MLSFLKNIKKMLLLNIHHKKKYIYKYYNDILNKFIPYHIMFNMLSFFPKKKNNEINFLNIVQEYCIQNDLDFTKYLKYLEMKQKEELHTLIGTIEFTDNNKELVCFLLDANKFNTLMNKNPVRGNNFNIGHLYMDLSYGHTLDEKYLLPMYENLHYEDKLLRNMYYEDLLQNVRVEGTVKPIKTFLHQNMVLQKYSIETNIEKLQQIEQQIVQEDNIETFELLEKKREIIKNLEGLISDYIFFCKAYDLNHISEFQIILENDLPWRDGYRSDHSIGLKLFADCKSKIEYLINNKILDLKEFKSSLKFQTEFLNEEYINEFKMLSTEKAKVVMSNLPQNQKDVLYAQLEQQQNNLKAFVKDQISILKEQEHALVFKDSDIKFFERMSLGADTPTNNLLSYILKTPEHYDALVNLLESNKKKFLSIEDLSKTVNGNAITLKESSDLSIKNISNNVDNLPLDNWFSEIKESFSQHPHIYIIGFLVLSGILGGYVIYKKYKNKQIKNEDIETSNKKDEVTEGLKENSSESSVNEEIVKKIQNDNVANTFENSFKILDNDLSLWFDAGDIPQIGIFFFVIFFSLVYIFNKKWI